MNKELAKTLTTALVQFIDRERPEGTMCCSNYECERIEKAFMDDRLDVVDSFIQKKLSRLTEFENEIQRFSDACAKRPTYIPSCGDIRRWSSEILSLAREQLIKDGYIIEKKAFHDAVEKVDPEVMKEVSDNVDKENELTEFEERIFKLLRQYKECDIPLTPENIKAEASMLWPDFEKYFFDLYGKDGEGDSALRRFYYRGLADGKTEAMADLERTYFCNSDKLPKWLKDDIATKELNAHTKGYNKGYKDAEKQYNESVAYRFPTIHAVPSSFGCDGMRCTNPQMDCINCPRKTTGGFNTTCGTSTSTLHGNTPATDGKEHSPSFTD